jgi:Membrane-bound lytic murein transglycosylase B
LRVEGWVSGQPWIEEVVIPQGFAFPTLHGRAAEWAALGLRRRDGRDPAGDGDAALFLPSGAAGPAFLLFPNYFVIKQYNNSDSYALSLGSLALRIAGAPAPAPWPARPVMLSRTDKAFIQSRLAAMGLYQGPRDGKFGPKARDAIHAYQRRVGLAPADGFATPAVLASLRSR